MADELPVRSPQEAAFDTRVARRVPTIFKQTNDLRESMRMAARLAAEDLKAEGGDPAEAQRLLDDYLRTFVERDESALVSQDLQEQLIHTIVAEGGAAPKQMLLEQLVKAPTGYRMFVWPNESKHPGKPHVTVDLDGVKLNISISANPEVLAGPKNTPGIGRVLKAVAKHRGPLLREWRDTRPDDQKVGNFKAKRSRARKKPPKRA
jgi:hypothetical protein